MEDDFTYCSKCGEPLTDDDTVYEDMCDECGNTEQIEQFGQTVS